MEIWYFETSAINFLQSNSEIGTLATRNFQLDKGRDWRISPTSIWEILLTTSEGRREVLIDYSQHLFSRELLPSPDELILGFIKSGMPKVEKQRDLTSTAPIALAWSEIVDDRTRTLIYDQDVLSHKANILKAFARNVHNILRDEDELLDSEIFHAKIDATLSELVIKAGERVRGRELAPDEVRFHKLSLFYILLVLCAEAEIENRTCKDFWRELEISSIEGRINYIVEEIPQVIWRGPFVLMAYMTQCQGNEKFSRGLWFDCLHCIYITYVARFFSNDNHFRMLREEIPEQRLANRIVHMSEVNFTSQGKNWLGLDGI